MPASLHMPHWLERLARPARPLVRAASLWSNAGGLRMSAAVSFYGILSFAPLIMVIVAVLGWWIDREMLESSLVAQVGGLIGAQGGALVEQALKSAQKPSQGIVATTIGFVVLLSGATGVFTELQEAFERVWTEGTGTAPSPKGWWHTASVHLRGVGYVLAFGFMLLFSLVISAVLNVFAGWADGGIAMDTFLRVVNEVVAFAVCAGLFVGLMRISAGPKPATKDLIVGGVIGATLFTLGRQLLTAYLAKAAVVSAYGAAGALVVFLMWIYFSSAALLFAAGCARAVHDERAARKGEAVPPTHACATPAKPERVAGTVRIT